MNLNVILITPHGRSGSVFLQSLLDGHKEIIGFPIIYDWYDFTMKNIYNLTNEDIIDQFLIKNKKILSSKNNSFFDLGKAKHHLDEKKFNIDTKVFKECFIEITKNITIISEKSLFEWIHLSLASYMKYDIKKIKYILVHIHEYTNVFTQTNSNKTRFEFIVKHYPDFKLLATIRDPREDFNSWKKIMIQRSNEFTVFETFKYIYHIKKTYQSLLLFIKNNIKKDNFLLIDLNRFHIKQKNALLIICELLIINFDDCLLKSTFFNIPWEGNSSDNKIMSTFDKKKAIYKWDNELSYKEKIILNTFHYSIINLFKYSNDNKYYKKIYSIIVLLKIFKFSLEKKDIIIIENIKVKDDINNKNYKFLPLSFSKRIIYFLILKSRYIKRIKMLQTILKDIDNETSFNSKNII